MGLLYGSNALKSLQDYKTQQDFNNSIIVSLQNVANAVDVVTKTAGDNGASLIEKQNAIDGLKASLSGLQTSFATLSTSFANLNTDNGQFKSDVDTTISSFNATVASFSGSLTSLTAANQQNTNDINTLKQTTNNDLLQKVMTGLSTLQDTIQNIIKTNVAQYHFHSDGAGADGNDVYGIAGMINDALAGFYNYYVKTLSDSTQDQIKSLTGRISDVNTANNNLLNDLGTRLDNTQTSLNSAIDQNRQDLNNFINTAQSLLNNQGNQLNTTAQNLSTEITRAKQAESDLTNAISEAAQTAKNEAQESLNSAQDYSNNNLVKGKSYTDDTVKQSASALTSAFQAGDQSTLTSAEQYADKLHAELLQTANAALNNSTTAENIAQEAQANANDAEGKVNALTPQVTAAATKASQALTVAQGAPQAGFNVIQGRTYSDGLVNITSSGSSVTITPANNTFMIGNYNGGTSQVGTYTLSSGYVYTCQVMGNAGVGFYMIDNRNSGVIYATILTPPSH